MMSTSPRARSRKASSEIPRSMAPVANTTVMKPPMARMNRKTCAEPNSTPLLNGPTCPAAFWMPYRPLIGDSSRSWIRSAVSSGDGTSW